MITLPESLVWYSTPESRKAGKISLLACAETVLAVAASLTFAAYLSFYTQILISLIVAPLVLLRSDAAVSMAWRWFRYDPFEEQEPSKRAECGFAIAGAILSGGAAYGLATFFLEDAEGWQAFIGGAVTAYIAVNLGLAALMWAVGPAAGTAWAAAAGALAVAVAVAVAVAGVLAVVGVLAVAVAGAVVVFWGPGFALGLFVRALTCRIAGALRYLPAGVAAMPENWKRILLVTDTIAPPELLPVPPDSGPKLDLRKFWSDAMEHRDRALQLGLILVAVLVCLPSFFYRLSIKSTFWLYGPLIYLAHRPAWTQDPVQRLAWLNTAPAFEWLRMILSCITLALTFWALADPGRASTLAHAVGMGEAPFTLLSAVFVLDLSRLQPWHAFTVTSAVLTFVLFFWLDYARRFIANKGDLALDSWQMKLAVFAWRLRALIGILWMALVLWYAPKHLHDTCQVDSFLLPITDLIYGPAACPLSG